MKWDDVEAPQLGLNDEVRVIVTLLEKSTRAVSGGGMAAAMAAIAAMPDRTIIEDPVAWQREMRQDRPLPGRE